MNINGVVYLVDVPNINVLKHKLSTTPPPNGGVIMNTTLCLDMDETDNMIELWFPYHAQKATLLCPPPIAMYKEIDGDQEGFIQEYNKYLEPDQTVQEFIPSIILYLYRGGTVMIYSPSYIADETIWVNILMMYFYTRFGLKIGTSAQDGFYYDTRYDPSIAMYLYYHNMIPWQEFISICSINPFRSDAHIASKLSYDMQSVCGSINPEQYYLELMNGISNHKTLQPLVTFERK